MLEFKRVQAYFSEKNSKKKLKNFGLYHCEVQSRHQARFFGGDYG